MGRLSLGLATHLHRNKIRSEESKVLYVMARDITVLIHASQKGDIEARGELYRLTASTLKEIATNHLRNEKRNHTLGVDGIVDDAFMKLVALNRIEFKEREHFYKLANTFMGRVLKDYAKWKKRLKRGGEVEIIELDESLIGAINYGSDLFDLLDRFGESHPRAKKAFIMSHLDGYSREEVAAELKCSKKTVYNDLIFAKASLFDELIRKD